MTVKPMLDKYARSVSLHLPDGWSSEVYHAFISPLRYKNKMYLYGVNTQIGFNAQGHYLYIGPPEHDLTRLDDDAWVLCSGIKYRVDRAEKVFCGDEVFFIWAIVREIVEPEEVTP